MRVSAPVNAGMPSGKTWSGWWGDMKGPKQKGIYVYSVSPFAQKPLKGALSGYLFWGVRRLAQQVPYFAPPFLVGYWVYSWGATKYAYYNSKEGHHAMATAEGHHH
ncbi:hypothetical protein CspHIS471_0307450 [Cutaneotrichosporon sp. HIS471]|nr:hypothetical protein CspHIS471_0307450 [Cutaneotrichosporon sp. HIS471]